MSRSTFASWSFATAMLVIAGCSCGEAAPPPAVDVGPVDGGPRDAGPGVDTGPGRDVGGFDGDVGPLGRCGNNMIEGFETCDDGNRMPDDGCDADCLLECGDGRVSGAELCDSAIAAGTTGACPTDCDDMMDCTTDALDGASADCTAACSHADITAAADDDMCCPPGEDATTDNDCMAMCGNMLVEPGETCDTGITTGAGSCPATCDDGIACSTDTTTGVACTIACTNTPITTPANGDGCCPMGATMATDNDCTAGCGDGVVVSPETCDTGIATGAGSCPTMASCGDGMACTADMLVGAGTCTAACMNTPITMPIAGDGCCPTGATIATDTDCAARCGDRVVTAPETCDDGNMTSGDGCSATCRTETVAPTAYRFTDMDIRDPHLFASVPIFGCQDVTNTVLGMDGINPQIQIAIRTDGDMPADGLLDLSVVQVFQPLMQAAGTMTPGYLTFDAECMGPYTDPRCTLPAAGMRTMATVTNMGGGAVCLGPVAGTTRAAYTPALVSPTAPAGGTCYVAMAGTVTIALAGIMINLSDAAIGGEWFGTPATEIRDGMIRGFLSEADANAAIIPAGTTGIATIDGQPISRLLRGGAMNCSMAAPMVGDLDMGPGGVRGWYFYLNFTAVDVPGYTEL